MDGFEDLAQASGDNDDDEAMIPEDGAPAVPEGSDDELAAIEETIDELVRAFDEHGVGPRSMNDDDVEPQGAGNDGNVSASSHEGLVDVGVANAGVLAGASEQDASRDLALALPPRPTWDQLVILPGGLLRFYHNLNQFTATCTHPGHARCVLTRSSLEGRRSFQGRPLGLLTAWLQWAETDVSCDTKDCHWDTARWPTLAARQNARRFLWSVPGGPALMACERNRRAEEPEEPFDAA